MTHRSPLPLSPLEAEAGPKGAEPGPAAARRSEDPMMHALIRAQVALATANAILLAMVAAFEGRPDSAVPDYVREARSHLAGIGAH